MDVWREADGTLWHRPRWGHLRPLSAGGGPLYVCPDTGLIRDHEYRKLAGQWYEVWWGTVNQDGTMVRTIIRKRQLGYKELRSLGLRD